MDYVCTPISDMDFCFDTPIIKPEKGTVKGKCKMQKFKNAKIQKSKIYLLKNRVYSVAFENNIQIMSTNNILCVNFFN